MTKRYTPKPGDIVTVVGSGHEWLVLAPAGNNFRPLLCNCPRGAEATVANPTGHTSNCDSNAHRNRPASYWLQNATTGELYRPFGRDEPVHKSSLTLVRAHSLPSRSEMLALV